MCDGCRRAGRMVYPQGLSGGTFLGNGVHALDLLRWFPGDFSEATGMVATLARAIASCEDNGVGDFRTADGCPATLRSNWTQWDPVFPFEVFGRDGFIHAISRETVIPSGRGATIGPGPNRSQEEALAQVHGRAPRGPLAARRQPRQPRGDPCGSRRPRSQRGWVDRAPAPGLSAGETGPSRYTT